MYTSCINYGMNYGEHNKGHRANGFTTDGGFAEYAVNDVIPWFTCRTILATRKPR